MTAFVLSQLVISRLRAKIIPIKEPLRVFMVGFLKQLKVVIF
jgi:hypothetical protein